MDRIADLEKRIVEIENRNRKVEKDKAWESSYTRRLLLVLFTYSAMAIYMKFVLGVEPFVNAIVPTLGFLLSTLTLTYFKAIWTKFFYKA